MMSNTVQAAWQTSGFPAKVEPWSPGAITSATFCFSSTAPMGSPPAGTRVGYAAWQRRHEREMGGMQ